MINAENNNIVKIEENLEDSKTNIKYELGEKPGTFEEYHRTTFAPNIKSETFLIQDEIKIDWRGDQPVHLCV